MSLTLTIENVEHLDNAESTQLRLDRHGAVIGRSPHSDWSLPDAKNYISSTHCEVDYRDGAYVLIDKSTNGTFLNDGAQRMASPHTLADGDLLTIGQYRVRVHTTGGAGAAAAAAPASAAPAGSSGGWDAWSGGGSAPAAAPAASPGWDSAPSGWAASSQPAASSGWAADAAPPAEAEPAAWGAAPAAPAAVPDTGWGAAPAAAPASPGWGAADTSPSAAGGWDAPSPATPASAPFAPPGSAWGAEGAGPAQPKASGWDAIGPAREAADPMGALAGSDGPAAPVSGRGALSQSWAAPRVETPAAPPPPPAGTADVWGQMAQSNTVDWSRGGFGTGEAWGKPVAAPAAAAPAASGDPAGAAWEAFLQASGVTPETLKAEPLQAAATAGALLKHLVAGLVVMLEARARAKAQLGAQSTTLELKGNNPIKFARSPERVLAQLLSPPERGFMGADDAVQDSFRDLQAHQMATLAAMQGALRSTLERFSPEAIRQRAEMRGVLAKILPSARDASLWQAYEREFEGVAKGSDEAFMDVFAKAFKAAYEQAAIQMKSQGR